MSPREDETGTDQPKPKRRRPGRASQAFGRLAQATQTDPVPGGDPVVGAVPTPEPDPAPATKPVRRFNLRFYYQSDSDALDDWVSATRRQVSGKIDVSRVAREVLREMIADPELSERVRARLREDEHPAR